MTAFESEAALAAFIRQQLDALPLASFIQQLQSSLAQGGRLMAIRVGATTLTWTASKDSAAQTVTHGLGRVPVAVLALPDANAAWPAIAVAAITPTTFSLTGRDVESVVRTGTNTVYWLAIG